MSKRWSLRLPFATVSAGLDRLTGRGGSPPECADTGLPWFGPHAVLLEDDLRMPMGDEVTGLSATRGNSMRSAKHKVDLICSINVR